jgi:uncharacterized protein YfaT (DUF1175 family)
MRPTRGAAAASIGVLLLALTAADRHPSASTRAADEGDRAAFRSWFTFLADAQFERQTSDVIDCASLVRHAYREALRPHTPAWYQRSRLPVTVAFPDVRTTPPVRDGAWMLFRVGRNPDRFAEFADAATLVRFNTRLIGRDVAAARPGDLLFFVQDPRDEGGANHLMVFVGESRFEGRGRDWLVYHTGPTDDGPGEVRKAPLADLMRHPSPRWRPVPANPAFAGVFRLAMLDGAR